MNIPEIDGSLNFLLTNRIPRLFTSWLMGRISKIEHPFFSRPALWLWRNCTELNLHEAQKQQFNSIHDCFTRELKPGLRPIDVDAMACSPCDGILGAHGWVEQGSLLQVKGFSYALKDLLVTPQLADQFMNHQYVTLRITASMYHRMHAPVDGIIQQVDYVFGDTWNVNPPALKRVPKLFCKNERAVLSGQVSGKLSGKVSSKTSSKTSSKASQVDTFAIVPVAAILVAGIRLHCTGQVFHQHHSGNLHFDLNTPIQKGQELGWFEHGSTIVLLVPGHWQLADGLQEGDHLKMGQALFH